MRGESKKVQVFELCSTEAFGGEEAIFFINISVLNKTFSDHGFFAKLLSSSAVSAPPGGGFLAQSS